MLTLLIAVGAVLMAVVGCVLLNPYPSAGADAADEERERRLEDFARSLLLSL
jgi:hypothetical protein